MGRIVVGIDQSECSRQALAWALEEARRRGDTLEIIYAFGATSGWIGMGDVVGAVVTENFAEDQVAVAARTVLDEEVAIVIGTECDVDLVLRTVPLHAGEALVEASKGADLLVVGTHGHGDIRSALVGSVSSHCVHHAVCPVVTVRERPAAEK